MAKKTAKKTAKNKAENKVAALVVTTRYDKFKDAAYNAALTNGSAPGVYIVNLATAPRTYNGKFCLLDAASCPPAIFATVTGLPA